MSNNTVRLRSLTTNLRYKAESNTPVIFDTELRNYSNGITVCIRPWTINSAVHKRQNYDQIRTVVSIDLSRDATSPNPLADLWTSFFSQFCILFYSMLTCRKLTKIKYNIYWKIISASWVGNKHAISLVKN